MPANDNFLFFQGNPAFDLRTSTGNWARIPDELLTQQMNVDTGGSVTRYPRDMTETQADNVRLTAERDALMREVERLLMNTGATRHNACLHAARIAQEAAVEAMRPYEARQ